MADLSVSVNGIDFVNPVLPAAGPNVRTAALMIGAAEGGAGGIVSKTVSTSPASDPRPSIRRTSNGGIMNCETWSEIPVEAYLSDLAEAKAAGVPLIVSIGYSPDDVRTLGKLIEREIEPAGFEFSTHYTGHDVAPLVEVARALRESVSAPIWIKLSPNFPDIAALARATEPFVDGYVAINSFGPVLEIDPENPIPLLGSTGSVGWMSGPPIRPMALRIVHDLSLATTKPIIGVGGVETGLDAVRFLMAGASLVQVCSAAIAKGQTVYGRIVRELDRWLEKHQVGSVSELIGTYPRSPKSEIDASPAIDDSQTIDAVMTVAAERCRGCRACVPACVHGALSMENRIAVVNPDLCIGCGYCQDSCTFGAMALIGQGGPNR